MASSVSARMEQGRFSSDSVCSSGEEELIAKEGQLRLRQVARWREQSRHVSFEPALFLLCFAASLSEIVLTNQVIFQTCQIEGYNLSECQLFNRAENATGPPAEIERKVQPAAATVTMVMVIVKSVVPAVAALLLGAWSDRYGRKPPMLIASFGMLLTYVLLTALTFLSTQALFSPWVYVVAYLPFSLFGGMTVNIAAAFSYLSDIINDQNRTIRMGFMEAAMLLGSLLGFLACSYILQYAGVAVTFCISTVCIVAAIIYVVTCVDDSILLTRDTGLCAKVADIFACDRLREITSSFFQRRSGYAREILWLIVIVTAVNEFASGGSEMLYLYTRRKFQWGVTDYANYQFTVMGAIIVGNVIGIPFLKKCLNCSDTTVAIISVVNYIVNVLINGFASAGWLLYLSTALTALKGTDGAALLTICSTLLPTSDMAKFYAMALSLTSLVPLGSAPLFTTIYQSTINNLPETFIFVSAGFFFIGLILMGTIKFLLNRFYLPELML